jgi:hypothetical protein
MIASRVIRLTLGCVSRCNELERCLEEPCDITIVPNPTTTSTSTLPITTTTSTSSTSSTTTTSTTSVPTTTTTSSSSTSTTTSTSSSTSTTTSSSSSTTTTTTTICQDCIAYGFPNPNDGNGTGTINGITVTTTYTGPSINAPGPRNNYNNCAGFPMDADTLYIAQLTGAFTLTISFSSPVNDVYISNSAMGYNLFPGQQECFTVNSDQGTPTLTLAGGCYDYGPVGNQICGSHQGGNTGGATRVSTTTPYTQLTITGTGIGNLAGYGFDICFSSCITTTTTSSSSSTTTTSTTLSPAECAALILDSGNVYTYDVITNTSVNRGNYSGANDIANTATKMWFLSSFIEEYNITVFPWSAAFNRTITYNTQLALGNGLCAKDNVTLITTNASVPFPHPIVSVDITGSTAVETIIGYLPNNIFVTGDLIYTTTGKLIITTSNAVNGETYIMQYDYATMNLEVQSTLPSFINNAFGLIEANNKLYIVGGTGAIYEVDLNYPYGTTLIQNTGLITTAGASQTPACCNVNLIPQSSSTTTTSSTSTTSTSTSSTSSTTSTTTTLAPSGFNTIYTHFDAL